MEELIEYLEMKNHYYEKFFSITTKFLEQANKDKWDDMAFFVDNRERLLNIIRSLDHKIARVFKETPVSDKEMERFRPKVKELMDRRKAIGEKIVHIDLELISKIDELKTGTIKELKKTVETNQQIDSFTRNSSPKRMKVKDA